MSDIRDPRITEIERLLIETNTSIRSLSAKVKISNTTIIHWLSGKNKRQNPNKPWIDDAISYLREQNALRQKKLSTFEDNSRQMYTVPFYNSPNDSASSLDLSGIVQHQVANSILVNPLRRWSAKGVVVKPILISSFPGSAGTVLKLNEPFHAFKRGSFIFMKETDYPTEMVYLMFQSAKDSDSKLLGWIDPSISSTQIQTPSGEREPISEWEVTHFAFGYGWGSGDSVTDINIRSNGIRVSIT